MNERVHSSARSSPSRASSASAQSRSSVRVSYDDDIPLSHPKPQPGGQDLRTLWDRVVNIEGQAKRITDKVDGPLSQLVSRYQTLEKEYLQERQRRQEREQAQVQAIIGLRASLEEALTDQGGIQGIVRQAATPLSRLLCGGGDLAGWLLRNGKDAALLVLELGKSSGLEQRTLFVAIGQGSRQSSAVQQGAEPVDALIKLFQVFTEVALRQKEEVQEFYARDASFAPDVNTLNRIHHSLEKALGRSFPTQTDREFWGAYQRVIEALDLETFWPTLGTYLDEAVHKEGGDPVPGAGIPRGGIVRVLRPGIRDADGNARERAVVLVSNGA